MYTHYSADYKIGWPVRDNVPYVTEEIVLTLKNELRADIWLLPY